MSKEEHAGEGTRVVQFASIAFPIALRTIFRINEYTYSLNVPRMHRIGLACFASGQLDERHPNSKRQEWIDLCHGHDKPYCCCPLFYA